MTDELVNGQALWVKLAPGRDRYGKDGRWVKAVVSNAIRRECELFDYFAPWERQLILTIGREIAEVRDARERDPND